MLSNENTASIVGLISFFLDELRSEGLVEPCDKCNYPVPTPMRYPTGSLLCGLCYELTKEQEEPEEPVESNTVEEGEDG